MKKLFFAIGGGVCHQLPERSIEISGQFLPLCARCTGIYMGIGITFLYLLFRKRLDGNKPPDTISAIIAALCLFPFMADGAGSYLGLWNSNNGLRIFTGVLGGCVFPVFYILAVHFRVDGKNEKVIMQGIWEIAGLLFVSFLFSALVLWNKLPYYLAASVSSLGVVLFYLGIIFLILKFILKRYIKKEGIFILSLLFTVFWIGIIYIIRNLVI